MNCENSWYMSTYRLGRATLLAAMAASFLPNLALWAFFGALPPAQAALPAWAAVLSAYGVFYVVQPLSYYPVFGFAGTYMGVLAGNMSNTRLPAALSAMDSVGAEPGTDAGETAAALGIAGSVLAGTAVYTFFIFFGSAVLSLIPKETRQLLASLILPSIFGALTVIFAAKRPRVLLFAFPIVFVCRVILGIGGIVMTFAAIFLPLGAAALMHRKER